MKTAIRTAICILIACSLGIMLPNYAKSAGGIYDISRGGIKITSNTISYVDESGNPKTDIYAPGPDGDVLVITQTKQTTPLNTYISTKNTITVTDSADISLVLDNIYISAADNASALSIEPGATVNLTLSGGNFLNGGMNNAGISVPEGASLTITGAGNSDTTDVLVADGGASAAGIGGCNGKGCGKIVINGGFVHATGGYLAAEYDSSHSLQVYQTGSCAAGIGGGTCGSGGLIVINSGVVYAQGLGDAGLGGGNGGGGGTININGGYVVASNIDGTAIKGGAACSINIRGGRIRCGGIVQTVFGALAAERGASISISGGIVDIGSMNILNGSTAICGGTVRFTSADPIGAKMKTESSFKITGGSVNLRAYGMVIKNGAAAVYLTTVTMPGFHELYDPTQDIWSHSEVPNQVTYSVDGAAAMSCYADGYGRIYLWLPVKQDNSPTTIKMLLGNRQYTVSGIVKADNTNAMTATAASDGNPFDSATCRTAFSATPGSTGWVDSNALSVDDALVAPVLNNISGRTGGNAVRRFVINGANGASVTVPVLCIRKMIDSGIESLMLVTNGGTIQLDKNALESVLSKASDSVTFALKAAGTDYLPASVRTSLGTGTVYRVMITSGKTVLSSFGSGKITVSVPCPVESDPDPSRSVVYVVSPDGQTASVTESVYDSGIGYFIFKTSETGNFAVKTSNSSFSDVSGWPEPYIAYLSGRHVMNGTGTGMFSPGSTITRAQFVTILANMSGNDLSGYKETAFSDVTVSDWFSKAVQWAYESGVISNTAGYFHPNDNITREDMAVMLSCYCANIAHVKLPAVTAAVVFPDNAAISPNAADPVNEMQKAGIISGRPDGSFDPSGSATRAEAAKMIAMLLQIITET